MTTLRNDALWRCRFCVGTVTCVVCLRVVTFNLRHGTTAQGKRSLEQQAALLRSHNPDLILLQELDEYTCRSGVEDQLRSVSTITGLQYSARAANLSYEGGWYGTAVLSRHPLTQCANYLVPSTWTEGPLRGEDGREHLPEQRSVLCCVVLTPEGPVAAANTHASMDMTERISGVETALRWARRQHGPAVIGGDFNTDGDESTRLFGTEFSDVGEALGPTFRQTRPPKRLDRLYVRGFRVMSAGVEQTELSDHDLMWCELSRERD